MTENAETVTPDTGPAEKISSFYINMADGKEKIMSDKKSTKRKEDADTDKRMTEGRILRFYLRDRVKPIFLYLLVTAVYFIVISLYGYSQVTRNMFYAVQLVLFIGVLALIFDYLNYHGKCRALFSALQKTEERTASLPKAETLPDKLYGELLFSEEQDKKRLLTLYDEKQQDMADYYTMWTHQIKTPIAALRLLLEDQKSGESEQGTDILRESEELFRIEQYVEMALCFARLDSSSSDFLFKTCNIRNIVKQALRKYSVLFLRSGLSFQIGDFEILAVTDEKWLCFVIEQLISNALKYTRQGGIHIYGADKNGRLQNGRTSYLVIADTGIGIREADLPRIFERGFTGYNGRIEKKSTGLGLYLCDCILKKMSHTIRVISSPGQGTKVILGFEQ